MIWRPFCIFFPSFFLLFSLLLFPPFSLLSLRFPSLLFFLNRNPCSAGGKFCGMAAGFIVRAYTPRKPLMFSGFRGAKGLISRILISSNHSGDDCDWWKKERGYAFCIAGRISARGCGGSGNCQSNAQDTFEFHTEPFFLKNKKTTCSKQPDLCGVATRCNVNIALYKQKSQAGIF